MIKVATVVSILSLALAGCFNPDTPAKYVCDQKDAPDCPDGYTCKGKICVDDNAKPDAGGDATAEASTPDQGPDKDQKVADQKLADQKVVDKKVADKKVADKKVPAPDSAPDSASTPDSGACKGYSNIFSGTGMPTSWTKKGGNWTKQNGVLKQIDTTNSGAAHSDSHVIYYDGNKYGNFTLEVDAKFLSGAGTANALGVVYRYTDPQNFYMVYFVPSGGFEFLMVKNGVYSSQAKKTGGWVKNHKIRLEVVGSSHSIYRDGTSLISKWTEPSLKQGYVGLITFQASVEFDNFKICTP